MNMFVSTLFSNVFHMCQGHKTWYHFYPGQGQCVQQTMTSNTLQPRVEVELVFTLCHQ